MTPKARALERCDIGKITAVLIHIDRKDGRVSRWQVNQVTDQLTGFRQLLENPTERGPF